MCSSNSAYCLRDVRPFVVLALLIMQISVVYEAVFGSTGKIVFLYGGFLILVGVAIYVMMFLFRYRQVRIQHVGLLFTFLPFEIIIFLHQPEMAQFSWIMLRVICYFLILLGAALSAADYLRTSVSDYIYGFAIPLLSVISSYFYMSSLKGVSVEGIGRVTAGEDISSVGLSFSLCLFASANLALFITVKSLLGRVLNGVAVVALLIPVVVSASRGALVAFFCVFLFLIPIIINLYGRKSIYLMGVIPVVALFGFGLFSGDGSLVSDQFDMLVERFARIFSDEEDASSSGRMEIISIYTSELGSLILFGFPNYAGPYPHNLFLDFFFRYGIYGGIIALFVYFFVFKVWSARKEFLDTEFHLVLMSVMVFSFVNSQISMTIEFLRFFWLALFYFIFFIQYRGRVNAYIRK